VPRRSPSASALVVGALAVVLCWRGAVATRGDVSALVGGARALLVGPVVLAFVAAVLVVERIAPAERRPMLARGHVQDALYLVLYAVAVVPVIALSGAGFGAVLRQAAPWLVLPRVPAAPRWAWIVLALVVMDLANWFAHWTNHHLHSLWRLHAVHHAQEEMSVLTSFRAHPLVHVSFLVAVIPALALSRNAAPPAFLITAYICLAALPHANVRWSFGRLGRVLVNPAYHRLHHALDGTAGHNLGTILTVWDVVAGCATFPARDATAVAVATGLRDRPVPVEQDGRGHARAMAAQLSEVLWSEGSTEPNPAVAT
jgi:sterol desaturase/sphingolipid hydroxylase (fatty acid hydroxylase superfamily)